MKIEKMNEHQIRCTLTQADLDERNIKFSELTYGSEKANLLFKDVMKQANFEFGFEPDGTPLMIEAIPMQSGVVVFVITKVEDPEELDTRFSRFAPSLQEKEEEEDEEILPFSDNDPSSDYMNDESDSDKGTAEIEAHITGGVRDIANFFQNVLSAKSGSAPGIDFDRSGRKSGRFAESSPTLANKIFVFDELDDVIRVARLLKDYPSGDSTLYKDPESDKYYLLLHADYYEAEDYKRVCLLLSDFCKNEYSAAPMEARIDEHFKTLIESDALHSLSSI